jgi:Rha family phage regulatory protein
MVNLVEIRENEILCDSQVVARKFGYKHASVVVTINKLIDDLSNLRAIEDNPYFLIEEREYRGTKFTAFLMSREFFSLLAMRFKGEKALLWQMTFNKAFYELEKRLIAAAKNSDDNNWLQVRTQTKQARLAQTDVIKEFVDYATEQGSVNAKFYYKHITNATYRALGLIQHKKPKLRDTLDGLELAHLMVAETLAKKLILKYMKSGEHYKAIFVLVKQDLEDFAKAAMLGAA